MSSGSMLTGAQAVVAALERFGARVVFGLPGVHNLALWRAVGESSLRRIGVRHEQAAAYAADGYARASGSFGVALTTTGPGAANTLAAVGEAWASRQPVLVIATDIPSRVRRQGVWRGALHEATDQAAMFEPVVKVTFRVQDAADTGPVVSEAIRTAMAPPRRPVYVEIPTDLLSTTCTARDTDPPGSEQIDKPRDGLDDVASAARLLSNANRPLIWVGGGAVQAHAGQVVGELATKLAAPVITTYSARGLLGREHPCLVDAPPHVPAVGALWDEADVILAVGSDFDGMTTLGWAMPQPETLIAINIDPHDGAKNYVPDLLLAADAAEGCAALLQAVEQRMGLDRLGGKLAALRREVRAELARTDPEAAALLAGLERVLPADTTLVCDMCIPGYWIGGFLSVAGPGQLAYPLGWGTLGCAFPQGLGAALAGPSPVVSISGDGGFLYAVGELATAAQEGIPLTAVIVDDGGYGMLRFDQEARGDPRDGVDLHTPDFVALAQSFGVHAEAVTGVGDAFVAALQRQIAREAPTVLIAKASLRPPPNTSPRWYRR